MTTIRLINLTRRHSPRLAHRLLQAEFVRRQMWLYLMHSRGTSWANLLWAWRYQLESASIIGASRRRVRENPLPESIAESMASVDTEGTL